MISAIVAVDNNWGIGSNGQLLESIPDDLKRFKELTKYSVVIMGRKTWESLPKKPLPDRLNLVITNQPTGVVGPMALFFTYNEAICRLELIRDSKDEEWFIIGGGQIYNELLSFCDKVYVTKIYKDYDNVDTYFPNLDEMDDWKPVNHSDEYIYNGITYQFWDYDRIS